MAKFAQEALINWQSYLCDSGDICYCPSSNVSQRWYCGRWKCGKAERRVGTKVGAASKIHEAKTNKCKACVVVMLPLFTFYTLPAIGNLYSTPDSHSHSHSLTVMYLRRLRAACLNLQDAVHYACLSLFTMVVVLVMYRHFWQGKVHCQAYTSPHPAYGPYFKLTCCVDSDDPNKCNALLTRGRWLDALDPYHSVNMYQNWQPAGCMMHDYKAKDLTTCLKSRRIVFIGDSVTRQIFWALAKKLGIREQGQDKHSSISVHAHGVEVNFFWDPYLNTSILHQEVAAVSLPGARNNQIDRAAILLLGGGLWNARYLGDASQQHFESSASEITRALQDRKKPGTPSSRSDQGSEGEDDLTVIAPIHIPHYDALSPERARTITPARVKHMFQHLQQMLVRQNVTVAWCFSHMIRHEASAYDQDGLHIKTAVASQMAEVLLNARCNAVLRQTNFKGYPMDKTCCNGYQRPNWIQSIILNVSLGLLPALTLITLRGENCMSVGWAAS